MAIIWDGRARPHLVLRVLEELATQFEPSLVSNLSLALSPSIACLHFSAAFSAYSRTALNQLEATEPSLARCSMSGCAQSLKLWRRSGEL